MTRLSHPEPFWKSGYCGVCEWVVSSWVRVQVHYLYNTCPSTYTLLNKHTYYDIVIILFNFPLNLTTFHMYFYKTFFNQLIKYYSTSTYNEIFSASEYISITWKHVITIPIPKPGKNKFGTNRYRLILLFHMQYAKFRKKCINLRLRWVLEKSKYHFF